MGYQKHQIHADEKGFPYVLPPNVQNDVIWVSLDDDIAEANVQIINKSDTHTTVNLFLAIYEGEGALSIVIARKRFFFVQKAESSKKRFERGRLASVFSLKDHQNGYSFGEQALMCTCTIQVLGITLVVMP